MKVSKYSYSKINSFNTCRLKYKILYVDKIYKKDESIDAFLGKIVHQTLEWIHLKKINRKTKYFSLDNIILFYKEKWIDNWHHRIFRYKYINRNKTDYFTSGINFLVKYYQTFGPSFNQNAIEIEKKLEYDIKNYTFKAIIDRIDQENSSTIHVIDYKTSKKMLTEKKMKNDMQMGIYGLGVSTIYPEIDNIKLSHYYVSTGKFVTIKFEDIDIDKFQNKLINNIIAIEKAESSESFELDDSNSCNWCNYCKPNLWYKL
ncbi:MAG: hypothetical protein CMG26_00380 [Candidatus Marinimicrobia bacterium]|nr:hypothetical protein [Candidatus Neomarinimicrobiota bacterium]|tara:strand:+ start:352 stop:1128 length:777 start_codon:yes stop_codon:yes gene_type:complete